MPGKNPQKSKSSSRSPMSITYWRKSASHRLVYLILAIVFAFGLVHGLGFAGALTGLGVTGSQFISTLIAFNLGIESGQILVILPCLMLVKAFRLLAKQRERTFMLCASAAFGMTGCFWFAERLFS